VNATDTAAGVVGLIALCAGALYLGAREWRRRTRLRSWLRLLILFGLAGSAVDAVVDIPKAVGAGDVWWMLAELGWLVCPFVFWVRWSSDLGWKRLLFVDRADPGSDVVGDDLPGWLRRR
jgi:uncharacterized membrane protein HdeD (DUF308 family)